MTTTTARARLGRIALTTAACVLLLGACTLRIGGFTLGGGDGAEPNPTATLEPFSAYYNEYFNTYATDEPAAAGATTARFEVSSGEKATVEARVYSVTATDAGTYLRWGLVHADEQVYLTSGLFADPTSSVSGDTSGVRVTDVEHDVSVEPLHTMSGSSSIVCLCSSGPSYVGPHAVLLYASLPALPTDATQVEVTIPGFDAITVDVSRA